MTSVNASRDVTRRNSSGSLGLVGIPSLSEPAQTADAFEFEIDPSLDYGVDLGVDITAEIDAFCANYGVPNDQSFDDHQIIPNGVLQTNYDLIGQPQAAALIEQYGSYMYDPTDPNLFPVQQCFRYPEPQDYYSAPSGPYFDSGYDSGYDLLNPLVDPFGAQGLTAIPGNNTLIGYENVQYPAQQHQYLPDPWALPIQEESPPTQTTDHVPVETSTQYATYPSKSPRASPAASSLSNGPIPSANARRRKRDEPQGSDSDSDEDYYETEPRTTRISRRERRLKRERRKQHRKSSLSSASTSAGPPPSPVKYTPGEKPKKHEAKSWVRINANTEGDTRTAKINNWKNKYEYKPMLRGTWVSGKHTFKYTNYENVDFLTEAPMSTRKIRDYIMNYPCDDQQRLILWIQKMPADQGRRYGSQQHSKCAFKDCPIQRYVEGTISTGEYRVAFDEKHFTYGDKVDPYDCTAFAHLYCMEQFLDFEKVCQLADVRVDTRLDLPLEPNGKAAFSMVDVPARAEMERFVKLAAKGKLRSVERWCKYPFHGDYERDQQKPHEYTLTYVAHCMYEEHQDDSHKKQAALRRVTVAQRRVHLGDLEMSVADKRILAEVFKRKKKGRNDNIEKYYDHRIRYHIQRAEEEARRFLAEKKKRTARGASKKGKKSKVVVQPEESDEEQTTYTTRSPKTRRTKHMVNYAESPIEQLHHYDEAAYTDHQADPVQDTEQQVQQYQTDLCTVNRDTPESPPIDPTLDTPYGLYAVPATPRLNIEDFENFPTCEDDLPEDNLEKLLSLERRQSCTGKFGPMSILKSPGLGPGRTPRRAVFGAQPVTDSKEYWVNDPPSAMCIRRSGRIQAQSGR